MYPETLGEESRHQTESVCLNLPPGGNCYFVHIILREDVITLVSDDQYLSPALPRGVSALAWLSW